MKGYFVYKWMPGESAPIEFQGFYTDWDKAVADVLEMGEADVAIMKPAIEINEMLPYETIHCAAYWPVQGMTTDKDGIVD